MKEVHLQLDYRTIDELVELIDEPNRSACLKLLDENRMLFERTRGSTFNHQIWPGGYIDHITDGMNYANHLYDFDSAFGRPLPFSKSDALLAFFLHDLEKPWAFGTDERGEPIRIVGFDTKVAMQKFREEKIASYGFVLSPQQVNGYKYAEGEQADYSSKHRVMNELAAFVHKIDNWSARGWYEYPKAEGDEWEGAGRFRTT